MKDGYFYRHKALRVFNLQILPMRKKHRSPRFRVFLISLILVVISLGDDKSFSFNSPSNEPATISTPAGFLISVEIAETADKRAEGLMFRKSLKADQGMLFIFPEMGYWTFWMKNTLIPLDILWMDELGKILHVESQVPICTKTDDSCPRYSSTRESLYVLEIRDGMAKKLGLTPGKQLSITLPSSTSHR